MDSVEGLNDLTGSAGVMWLCSFLQQCSEMLYGHWEDSTTGSRGLARLLQWKENRSLKKLRRRRMK